MWVKLDDRFPSHPKIVGLSDRAFRALITGFCHCGEHLTDGYISKPVASAYATPKVQRELTTAGLWVERAGGGGFDVHGFLDYNPTRVEVEEKREARARAGRVGGQRSAEARRQAFASTDAEASAEHTPSKGAAKVNPDPVPGTRTEVGVEENSKNNPSQIGTLAETTARALELIQSAPDDELGVDIDDGKLWNLRKMLPHLNDVANDDEELLKLARVARKLPEARILSVRQSVEDKSRKVGIGWAIRALQAQADEHAAQRSAA
jgi:hypothetical protein